MIATWVTAWEILSVRKAPNLIQLILSSFINYYQMA